MKLNITHHMPLSDTVATRMSYCLLKSEHTVWIGGAHVAKLHATSCLCGPLDIDVHVDWPPHWATSYIHIPLPRNPMAINFLCKNSLSSIVCHRHINFLLFFMTRALCPTVFYQMMIWQSLIYKDKYNCKTKIIPLPNSWCLMVFSDSTETFTML